MKKCILQNCLCQTTAIGGIVIGHNNQCITACPEHDYTKPQSLKISTCQGRELNTIMIHN